MSPNRRKAALTLAAMLLAATASILAKPTRLVAEMGPKLNLEAKFPQGFGDWRIDPHVMPVRADPVLQRVVEEAYDQVVSRTYVNSQGYRIMLSAAYTGKRDQAMDVHRPEVCYPAQGLSIKRSTWDASLTLPERELPLKRLVAGNGERHEPISYWLVVGRDVANTATSHRVATFKYGLTGRIPDGMLVRVSSVDPDETRSFAMQDAFVRDMLAAMDTDFRSRLLGAL